MGIRQIKSFSDVKTLLINSVTIQKNQIERKKDKEEEKVEDEEERQLNVREAAERLRIPRR